MEEVVDVFEAHKIKVVVEVYIEVEFVDKVVESVVENKDTEVAEKIVYNYFEVVQETWQNYLEVLHVLPKALTKQKEQWKLLAS